LKYNYTIKQRKNVYKSLHPNTRETTPPPVVEEKIGMMVTEFQVRKGERVNGKVVVDIDYAMNGVEATLIVI